MDELEKQKLVSWLNARKADMPVSVISEEELFAMVNRELDIEAQEPKEEGYDEWVRERLERTMRMVDSGEMRTYTHHEVMERLAKRRASRK
jgi:hypothetical protein